MRKIKFRAWNGKVMSFFTLKEMADDMGYVNVENVMQYIDLKDETGREIYEGDLLKIKMGDTWQTKPYEVKGMQELYADRINTDNYMRITEMKIIGNIYENNKQMGKRG